ncbi:glycosyltransferase family 4 protein [Alicyclobacillus macrosporangiidus]|uniref:Glycosyltransferase involved in cell wall bisynthesis n=1 Tax=Alicyclobacillus macrosporangiidus TaxID=392015 RepID=A0A1I7KW80_9BACL|nr:glycosyltransferase family 4 protein [Alicyclobacillus macrosporangiidus]SFV01733.1 Glycosyltransferase involved in cell wall bisynthesis [Alicyclobacillus macrosporangiidus]
MRVLQCPTEIAGQMGILTKALARAGIESTAYNTFHSYLGYRDHIYNVDPYELEAMMGDAIQHFDVFHFHYGQTMAPDFADLPEIFRLGKPMVMHHWGNDVRTHALASANNPYVYTGDSPPPEQIHQTLTQITRYVRHAIVQDHEVYAYVASYYKRVHVVPIALDVRSIQPSPPSVKEDRPLIVHAPTNPLFKGTAYIEEAIETLREQGLRFRYQRVENVSNQEALALYRSADIVVDQILCGSYGLLAVESMSLGKPVVGYIREDLVKTFPETPPIVSANPDQVYDALKELIQNPVLRVEKGRQGRLYAERHHAAEVVAQQLLRVYREISNEVDVRS